MEDYSFCSQSAGLLTEFQKEVAKIQPVDNKWLELFRNLCQIQDVKSSSTANQQTEESLEDKLQETAENTGEDNAPKEYHSTSNLQTAEIKVDTKVSDLNDEDLNNYADIIDDNLESGFDDIVQDCFKVSSLALNLAERLRQPSLETLLVYTMDSEDVPHEFIKCIYQSMLPNLLTRDFTRQLVNILVKAYRKNKDLFIQHVLHNIIKETCSEDIRLCFIKYLDNSNKDLVLKAICNYKLSQTQFIVCLPSICILYRESLKTEKLQNFVYNHLYDYSNACVNNAEYGQLLLLYLQNVDNFNSNYVTIVSNHNSNFRAPCACILGKLGKG